MKKLIFTIIFLLVSFSAYAQNLVELSSNSKNGSYVNGLYVDLDSKEYTEHGTILIDIYEDYPETTERLDVFPRYRADIIIDQFEVKCKTKEKRKLRELHYLEGVLKGSEYFTNEFEKLTPVIGMKLYKMICK